MRAWLSFRWIAIWLLLVSSSLASENGEREQLDFFEKRVRPILVQRCYGCHAGEKSGGGLSLETVAGWQAGGESGPAIVPGQPEASLLIEAINYDSLEMPPADEGGKLPDEEIAILTEWVAKGAVDPRDVSQRLGGMDLQQASSWWAFQPLPDVSSQATPSPPVSSPSIDQFLDQKLSQQGLRPAGRADKRTLIRRATYDLTGLPPTAAEVEAFLADDSPAAFEKLIDRLLDSPQYGIQWGRHWLDVVRYADSAGENTDRPLPHAWRYRNWVMDAFNRDLPYDQFVRLQLAGDLAGADGTEQQRTEGIIATGYLAIARRFGHDIDKDMHLTYEDVIDNLGKNFLGLTLGCARCHDHKYDPVTSEDYYALYGVFASCRFSFPGCEPQGQPRDLVPLIEPAEADELMADYQAQLAAFDQQAATLAQQSQQLKQLAADSYEVLAQSNVGEGQAVALQSEPESTLDKIAMRPGELLQLTVLPNANHGADTTRIELEITKLDEPSTRWNVDDLISKFSDGSPAIEDKGATWCLLDVTDGPLFLLDHKLRVSEQDSLTAWANGELPSALVNASQDPVSVWTTLPGQSFFVHPGPQNNVAVAWICPEAGNYQIRGVVSDAHPAGLDGVSFRLEHFRDPQLGMGLKQLAEASLLSRRPKPQPPAIPVAYAVVDAEAGNSRMQLRGDPEQLGEEIPRRWLSVFGGQPLTADQTSGRIELANQIIEHPLFARVMVNRLWQWHFGRGLVPTPNDFGSRGEPPAHPELLDFLAAQFRAGGYRIKPLHRSILLSAAYQRSSRPDPEVTQQDPTNQWLASFSRRRLTAEELRDTLLDVSGQLDRSFGEAHPFPPESEWTYTQHNPFNAVYETNRRSSFLMVQRQRRHPYLALFDGADPNSSSAIRYATTVPTQALFFLNDPFFHQQAALFAQRTASEADLHSRVQLMFRDLFGRAATPAELQLASTFLPAYEGESQEAWAAYARVLMSTNEFLYVD